MGPTATVCRITVTVWIRVSHPNPLLTALGADAERLRSLPEPLPLTLTEHTFNILNVSSNTADLLPRARIRLAALELFGQQGFDRTTIRQIASRAGVSPGLVIHHFGSKKELKEACDAHALEVFRQKSVYLQESGPMPSLQSFLDDNPELWTVANYFVQELRAGGETAQQAYDLFCSYSDEMVTRAADAGMLVLPEDRQAAIALMTTWSIGVLVLGDLFARRLGGERLEDPEVMRRYSSVVIELLSTGVFTESYASLLRSVIHPTTG